MPTSDQGSSTNTRTHPTPLPHVPSSNLQTPLLGSERNMPDSKEDTKATEYGTNITSTESGSIQAEEVFVYDDSRKLGITSSIFLILNKMIGTGSKSAYSLKPCYSGCLYLNNANKDH